jgi:hypothetical protein
MCFKENHEAISKMPGKLYLAMARFGKIYHNKNVHQNILPLELIRECASRCASQQHQEAISKMPGKLYLSMHA